MRYPFILLIFISFITGCRFSSKDLPGKGAEDLWGGRVRLNHAINGKYPTVIVPFSTSNCGYCMIDGYFTDRNYIRNNVNSGGTGYHMCLFNPQLDIYAFQKHFGWETPVLTYPPGLHAFHGNGFPTVLAFRDGEQLIREFYNYAAFDSLNNLLWNGTESMHPTGNLHLATRLIYENGDYGAVCLVSDLNDISDDERVFSEKWKGYTFSALGSVTDEEKQKHLFIRSGSDLSDLEKLFRGEEIPLSFKGGRFILGGYSFDPDSAAFYGCFPNPFNRQKYIVLTIFNDHAKLFNPVNYLDYIVFTGSRPETGKSLLYGHFSKDEHDRWHFAGETAFHSGDQDSLCAGRCPLPRRGIAGGKPAPEHTGTFSVTGSGASGFPATVTTLGGYHCRFPEIFPGDSGSCWVTWEEGGDIMLGRVSRTGEAETWFAERGASDSYNPKLAVAGDEVWLFYLNNRDGYYRLYARSFQASRFSGEILVTPGNPFDAVTPEVVPGTGGSIVVAWCNWLANQRFLKYRIFKNGVPLDITDFRVAPPVYIQNYTNAWWPSLVVFRDSLWGAWNQHYPAVCGVYGGPLADSALTVTQPSETMDGREQGGYPDIFTDGKRVFVTWEGYAWDVYFRDAAQEIRIAVFDSATGRWSPGRVLTQSGSATINQTPCGACDSKGNKYIVWSGRDHRKRHPWGVYLTAEKNGRWSDPIMLSGTGETARYLKIVIGCKDDIWVSWHSGTGKEMQVRVLHLL